MLVPTLHLSAACQFGPISADIWTVAHASVIALIHTSDIWMCSGSVSPLCLASHFHINFIDLICFPGWSSISSFCSFVGLLWSLGHSFMTSGLPVTNLSTFIAGESLAWKDAHPGGCDFIQFPHWCWFPGCFDPC